MASRNGDDIVKIVVDFMSRIIGSHKSKLVIKQSMICGSETRRKLVENDELATLILLKV
jgi:hypothetical protein